MPGKNKGYSVFMVIMKAMVGMEYKLFFGVIAGFCMIVVVAVYKKYSGNCV